MIDKVKRNTLRKLGAGAVAASTAGLAGSAVAKSGILDTLNPDANAGHAELADIEVSTRVSSITNDLEVLITNNGRSSTTISQMTPSVTSTKRGRFDFSALMKQGNIELAPGQSLSVPMRPHAHKVDATDTSGLHAHNLTDALRRSFSVITDNDSFAKVHVRDGIRFY